MKRRWILAVVLLALIAMVSVAAKGGVPGPPPGGGGGEPTLAFNPDPAQAGVAFEVTGSGFVKNTAVWVVYGPYPLPSQLLESDNKGNLFVPGTTDIATYALVDPGTYHVEAFQLTKNGRWKRVAPTDLVVLP